MARTIATQSTSSSTLSLAGLTGLIPLYFTPSVCQLLAVEPPCFLLGHWLFLNSGFFVALLYGGFYVLMDSKAGFLAALLCMACWVGSSYLARHLVSSLAWKVVLAVQILCWTEQFLGHGIFEVLQIVFGYEPYSGFHSHVKQKIDAELKVWQDNKQKKMC